MVEQKERPCQFAHFADGRRLANASELVQRIAAVGEGARMTGVARDGGVEAGDRVFEPLHLQEDAAAVVMRAGIGAHERAVTG